VQKKDVFYPGRKFAIPRSCFVLFALPKHEWKKLDEWNRKKDKIAIAPAPEGEIFLLNEKKLEKWRNRHEGVKRQDSR
jgi:hypothetical protein